MLKLKTQEMLLNAEIHIRVNALVKVLKLLDGTQAVKANKQ